MLAQAPPACTPPSLGAHYAGDVCNYEAPPPLGTPPSAPGNDFDNDAAPSASEDQRASAGGAAAAAAAAPAAVQRRCGKRRAHVPVVDPIAEMQIR